MKKVYINILIGLMTISLIGITGIQLYWIKNALDVKNEIFERSVNDAVYQTARRLEDYQKMELVDHVLFSDSLNLDRLLLQGGQIVQKMVSPSIVPNGYLTVKIQANAYMNQQSMGGSHIKIPMDQEIKNLRDSQHHNNAPKMGPEIQKTRKRSININAINGSLESKTKELETILLKFAKEINAWEQGHKLDPNTVNKILSEELRNKGIKTDYAFCLTSQRKKIYSSSKKYSPKDAIYASLFPSAILRMGYKLGVSFPYRKNYIISSVLGMVGLSTLFSLIIIVTFGMSLYLILKQKKTSEMQNDFINNMTHEFKTPIATIGVAADTIMNNQIIEKPEQISFFANMIKKENKRMNAHVEKILRIARLQRKELELNFTEFDSNELVDRCIQSFKIQVEQRGGKITFLPNAKNPIIQTDPNHFISVINNLLDNANKYSPDTPEIVVETYNKDAGVVFKVKDNGMGMVRSVQNKVFERFYRQTSGNIHNVKGFGLGLNYVKAIVDAHKGKVIVKSEPGIGSIFEVYIPHYTNNN
ncbi:HAMP domain-containing histidine kinase [Halosquirtibacter laminarini]|uniref:HAMP domain-containing histidine kinase n=1 Tax=Halosquirtibacter laminarini TaxID=3374600 RepID=A0AC61NM63_9BACT|nr:HAMP domain-containing histidine kinase [Prolixibacteraceae bacterium]